MEVETCMKALLFNTRHQTIAFALHCDFRMQQLVKQMKKWKLSIKTNVWKWFVNVCWAFFLSEVTNRSTFVSSGKNHFVKRKEKILLIYLLRTKSQQLNILYLHCTGMTWMLNSMLRKSKELKECKIEMRDVSLWWKHHQKWNEMKWNESMFPYKF